MKKHYTEPEIEVRNYVLLEDVITASGNTGLGNENEESGGNIL